MRKDMSKVIVERPRLGRARAGLKPGRTRVVADDDGEPLRTTKGTAREPVREPRKTKWLNENLNPLKRYLAANVGRPWSKVYSEISEHLKPTSTVQQHVRDHLEDFVATKTRSEKGVLKANTRWGRPMPLSDCHQLYYVHPRTGLLRKNEGRVTFAQARRRAEAAAAAERAKRMREIDAKTQLHLFDGAWWEVKLAKTPPSQPYVDVVRRAKLSTLAPQDLYGRHGVHAVDKRQLSKAEIKRLKLR
jgi:hypothetical protein